MLPGLRPLLGSFRLGLQLVGGQTGHLAPGEFLDHMLQHLQTEGSRLLVLLREVKSEVKVVPGREVGIPLQDFHQVIAIIVD